jgi:hypothetical protein
VNSSTRRRRPLISPLIPGVRASGGMSGVAHSTRAYPKTRAYDDFSDPELPDWIGIRGKLETTGGGSPDIRKNDWSDYAAGLHKTQMLSDNHRVKVTLPDGALNTGRSQVILSSDRRMDRYYGMELHTDLLFGSTLSLVKGNSPGDCRRYEATGGIAAHNGDSFEVWYDRRNGMLRGYQNGSEQLSMEVPPYEIQHGPGHRWCGVNLGVDFLDAGPNFADFEAWDVTAPDAVARDTMDGPGISSHWTPVLNTCNIHRNWFFPQTMGPAFSLWSDAAVVWDTPLDTDSARLVFTAQRVGSGKYTAVLCSNSAMTSWIGVQFETGILANNIRIVTGTGPTTYTQRAVQTWGYTQRGDVYTVDYDHPTKTVMVRRNAKRAPFLTWTDGGSIVTHGASNRRVGQMWQTSLLSPGVEPSIFEAYNVDLDAPL